MPTTNIRFRRGTRVAAVGALAMASLAAVATPASAAPAGDPPPTIVFNCLTQTPRQCYSVAEFRAAYGIQPLIDRGLTGRGETVVLPEFIIDEPNSGATDIRADLALTDHTFGLPAAKINVVNTFAHVSDPFQAFGEEVGDVETVHEIAPDATIDVVLFPASTIIPRPNPQAIADEYAQTLRLAPSLGAIVSDSIFPLGEQCFTPAQAAEIHGALRSARDHHETVIVASGDTGAAALACQDDVPSVKGVNLPAADPNILAVGGTILHAAHPSGGYLGETAWNGPVPPDAPPGKQPFVASSGGFSSLSPTPDYQRGVAGIGAHRGVPDVAATADPEFGPAGGLTLGDQAAISASGGTSTAAPTWAGLVALADQAAHRPLGFLNPAIYRIAESPLYRTAFHDVTTGNNTVGFPEGAVTGYNAVPGWDPVTGWGSPNAAVLVPLLAELAGR